MVDYLRIVWGGGILSGMRKLIDLRSDTVTRPSPEMRKAIASAEVGDDVSGEDPTVNRLEELCAELTGKEASLFVSSGTQANLLAVKSWTEPGDEVIAEQCAHIANFEAGGSSAFCGVQIRPLHGDRGSFSAEDILPLVRGKDIHLAPTRLICMENTHTMAGGTLFPLERMRSVTELAHRCGIRTHLDGARIWNASIATGIDVREFGSCTDSICFCFSKGLGCPAGSILCGPSEFIERARRYRKMVGGAMRQVGILASAALYALEHNIERLAEDHRNAKRLAEALAELPQFSIDPSQVETNIVVFAVNGSSEEWLQRFRERGILLCPYPNNTIRAVTHLDVSSEEIDYLIKVARELSLK